MSRRIGRIDVYRTSRVIERTRKIHHAKVGSKQGDLVEIGQSECGLSRSKSRIELVRAPKEAPGLLVFRRFDIREMPHSAVIAFPSIEAVGRLAGGTFALAALERRLDCLGNLRGDLVLHRKDIGKVAVVPLGPKMPAGGGFDQLCRHPHPVAGLAHAAFEDVAHAKLTPDVFHRSRLTLVGEARIAGPL